MLDAQVIPLTASLHKDEDGVKWYVDREGGNALHYMEFDGRILMGSWVGPRWVFRALVSMPLEKRISCRTHDECMGAINAHLAHR